jgi:hypothetical protein
MSTPYSDPLPPLSKESSRGQHTSANRHRRCSGVSRRLFEPAAAATGADGARSGTAAGRATVHRAAGTAAAGACRLPSGYAFRARPSLSRPSDPCALRAEPCRAPRSPRCAPHGPGRRRPGASSRRRRSSARADGSGARSDGSSSGSPGSRPLRTNSAPGARHTTSAARGLRSFCFRRR